MNKQALLERKAQVEKRNERELQIVVGAYIIHGEEVLLIHHKKLDLWLPVGGHINKNETPDQAVIREAKEEVGLDVELLCTDATPQCGNMALKLANPFHVNVHSVGDHDHCCLFYVAKAKHKNVEMNGDELKNYAWFSKKELNQSHVPQDVKQIALTAFKLFEQASQL